MTWRAGLLVLESPADATRTPGSVSHRQERELFTPRRPMPAYVTAEMLESQNDGR
jgi:hypothetical protein